MNDASRPQIIALPSDSRGEYCDITFDGCYYYFLKKRGCEIVRYNHCLCQSVNIPVYRNYCCICYDETDGCFWAVSNECSTHIYKLDACMREVTSISLTQYADADIVVNSLTYCCCDDSLLFVCNYGVLKFSKQKGNSLLMKKNCGDRSTYIASICPGFLLGRLQDGEQSIIFYNECGQSVYEWHLPHGYFVKGIVNHSCKEEFPCVALRILTEDCSGSSQIIDMTISPDELGFTPSRCGFFDYKKCWDQNQCISGERSYAQVLTSIALVETALAHILNAEGEKIQKALACTDDIELLLCINRDVRETIVRATHLEQILYDKLYTLNECAFCGEPSGCNAPDNGACDHCC